MRRILLLSVYMICVAACGADYPTAPTGPQAPMPPSLTGQFSGTYAVSSCVESGAARGSDFCTNLGRGGTHIYTPSQSGSNLSGQLTLGGLNIPVTGNVGTDNVVSLTGSTTVTTGATLFMNTWRGVLSGNSLSGTLSFTIVTDAPVGSVVVQGSFALSR